MADHPTNSDRWSSKWTDVWYACRLFYLASTSEPIRSIGTPAQIGRTPEDVTMLNLDDNRTRKRNTPGDQSMRRTVQDLVSSIDPNVKIDPEVEDVRGLPAPVLA